MQLTHETIKKATEEYLKRGGKITILPPNGEWRRGGTVGFQGHSPYKAGSNLEQIYCPYDTLYEHGFVAIFNPRVYK